MLQQYPKLYISLQQNIHQKHIALKIKHSFDENWLTNIVENLQILNFESSYIAYHIKITSLMFIGLCIYPCIKK